jgi:hypothetical protein
LFEKIKVLVHLYRTNRILAQRVRKGQSFYIVFVIVISLLFTIFLGLVFFTNWIEFKSSDERKVFFSSSIFILFSLDVLFTLVRFQSQTLIEPYHLEVFPIGNNPKILFRFALPLLDYKSILYLSTLFLFASSFLQDWSFIKALICIFFMIIFLLTMNTWFLALSAVGHDVLLKNRNNSLILFFILILFLNGLTMTKKLEVLTSLPIISFVGNGLFYLEVDDWASMYVNMTLLILSLFLGLVILKVVAFKRVRP